MRAVSRTLAERAGACVDPAAVTILDRTFVRATGAPQTETATFSPLVGVSAATLCVEAIHVSVGEIGLNGTRLLGPSFPKADETFTIPVQLLTENSLAVELKGKPCKPDKPKECATLRVRAVAIPDAAPILFPVAELKPLNACCSDPTCDRRAFAAAGGVCPGDPRIRGPLVVDAPAAH